MVGLLVRVALIDTQSLRLDEATFLGEYRGHSVGHIWSGLASGDVHTPLYHTLMHFWVQLAGTSEWALRVPTVLLGAACIPLMYGIGRRLFGAQAGLFSAALMAGSPFVVWHSDEAKMYVLLLLLLLAAQWCLMAAVQSGGALRWSAYTLFTTLSLYTHLFALLAIPVHLAYVMLARGWSREARRWMISVAMAGVLFLPWIALFYRDSVLSGHLLEFQGTGLGQSRAGPVGKAVDLGVFLAVFLLGYRLYYLTLALLAGAGTVLLVRALKRRRAQELQPTDLSPGRGLVFSGAWLVLTVGVTFVVSLDRAGIWHNRYLIGAAPAVFLLVALLLALAFPRSVVAVLTVLAVMVAATVQNNLAGDHILREDFRAAATMMGRSGSSYSVLVSPPYLERPLSYYIGAEPILALPRRGTMEQAIRGELPAALDARQGSTLWAVVGDADGHDPEGRLWAFLDARYQRRASYRLGGGLELRRYAVPPKPAPGPPVAPR